MTIMSYYFKIKTDKRKGKRIMKNDNSIVKFTAFVLLITMVVLCLVSGTFAKYTSEFNGTDSAVVARWNVSDGDALKTFDIFAASKIYDTVNMAEVQDADVNQQTGGDAGEELGKIAPGTWGKFTYNIANNSEVTSEYKVTYKADEKNIFLLWSKDGIDWVDNVEELNVETTTLNMNTDQDLAIYWKWVFDAAVETGAAGQDDEADTKLGTGEDTNGIMAVPKLDVDVVFTQVD